MASMLHQLSPEVDVCSGSIWLKDRPKQVDRSGGALLIPAAMYRAPGHACSRYRATDCAVLVQTTSRRQPGGGCRSGGDLGQQRPLN